MCEPDCSVASVLDSVRKTTDVLKSCTSRSCMLNKDREIVFWMRSLHLGLFCSSWFLTTEPSLNITFFCKEPSHFHHTFHHVASPSKRFAFFKSNRLAIAMPNFAVLLKWPHHNTGRNNEWLLMTYDRKGRPIVT